MEGLRGHSTHTQAKTLFEFCADELLPLLKKDYLLNEKLASESSDRNKLLEQLTKQVALLGKGVNRVADELELTRVVRQAKPNPAPKKKKRAKSEAVQVVESKPKRKKPPTDKTTPTKKKKQKA